MLTQLLLLLLLLQSDDVIVLRANDSTRLGSDGQLTDMAHRLPAYYLQWRFGVVGSDVRQINEVTLRWARLVLGWVTVSGFNSRCGKFILV